MQTFHPLAKEAGFALSKGTSTPAGSYLKSSRLALTFDPKGGLITVGEKGQYFFFYESKLPHLTYNEYHNANAEKDPTVFYRLTRPGPYNFQLRGQEVFRFFSENVSLPDPMAHITEEAL